MLGSSFTKTLIFLLLIFSVQLSFGQKNRNQLEKEKKENLRQIAEAERILTETTSKKEVTLGQLQALNQQIKARQSLINSYSAEIKILDGEISDLRIVVNALQNDLENLKQEYADQIYSSYKANKGNNRLMFLFSAKNFNQLVQRMKYLEQYSKARKLQAVQIEEVATELVTQKGKVEAKRSDQQRLLNQQVRESRKLANSKQKQSSLIAQLSKKEKELRREMESRKKADERLNTLIASIVESEVEKSVSVSNAVTASESELSRQFESKKNKLAWPVSSGFVSSKFGKQQHAVLKRVTIINEGIRIQTEKEAEVKAVFEGVVTSIGAIAGMNNVVLIKHGDYFTVYARLKSVNVKKGQRVRSDDVIGEIFTNQEGISELIFRVYKGKIKLNPENWLALK